MRTKFERESTGAQKYASFCKCGGVFFSDLAAEGEERCPEGAGHSTFVGQADQKLWEVDSCYSVVYIKSNT